MTALAFIPARGGSKGLPRKNLMTVGGRSLIQRAVEVALTIETITDIVVSSDDDQILDEGLRCGASVDRRPSVLASDESTTLATLREFLCRNEDVATVVLLQPTSPLREAAEVRTCLDSFDGQATVTTVTRTRHPPEWLYSLEASGRLTPLLADSAQPDRRQDSKAAYHLTGAVYVASADRIRAGLGLIDAEVVGIEVAAARSIDVDSEMDLILARALDNRPAP